MSDVVAKARATLTTPGALFEIAREDVRGTTLTVFRHRARSLLELLDASARFPERTYLVEGDVRRDFGAHLAQVDALAAAPPRKRSSRPAAGSTSPTTRCRRTGTSSTNRCRALRAGSS